MELNKLTNKPIVEAIFEIRWELLKQPNGIQIDPHYKILPGILFEKLRTDYPFHERLPSSNMPDEIASYVVQHRFRIEKDKWPLIQIGPGVLTVNETEGYDWNNFRGRIKRVLDVLLTSYPELDSFKVSKLILRYINAVEFDYKHEDIFKFLKDKMKIRIEIENSLFKATGLGESALRHDLRFSFPSENPPGTFDLRLLKGNKNVVDKTEALVWDMLFNVFGEDVPCKLKDILTWIDAGHEIIESWFFKMTEGDLLEGFK